MLKGTVTESRGFLLLTSFALWPAWFRLAKFGWASNRTGLAMFGLICLGFLYEQRRIPSRSVGAPNFVFAQWIILVAYLVGFFTLPPLGLGVLAAEALAVGMLACYPPHLARERIGLAALLPLTLPLDMALQFVVGYPLRRASAIIASLILTPYGAFAEGTILHCRGGSLDVDAPCSGVNGLWAFLILGSLLALANRSSYRQTLSLILLAGLSGWLYNIVRTCLLFMYRFHVGPISEVMHAGIGILAFAMITGIYAAIGTDLLRKRVPFIRHWRLA